MAGRKQHVIPKHFLKAFVVSNERDQLYLYRLNESKPVLVSCNDAAANRDYYSKPSATDKPTLDDLITEYENNLKYKVDKVRTVPAGEFIPVELISEIVVHLAIRSSYFRDFKDAQNAETISLINSLFYHPSEFIDSSSVVRHRVPTYFEKPTLRVLERYPCIRLNLKSFVRLLYQIFREEFVELHKASVDIFTDSQDCSLKELRAMIRKEHISFLEKELVPLDLKSKLEAFKWRIVDYPTKNAVLPDCVAVAEDAEGWKAYILLIEKP